MGKEDVNKLYLGAPFAVEDLVIIGVGKEVIAFGEKLSDDSEMFIHFRKEDWKTIRDFIDRKIREV